MSDFVTLYAYRLAREKANPQYPYGRGKIEPMGGLVVSGLLVGGGLGMANHSVDELLFFLNEKTSDKIAPVVDQVSSSPLLGFFEHSHDYSTLMSLSPYAALLLVGSIGLKEYLYRVTLKVGHRTKSSVLIANAYHHRSDVVTSVVALVGVGGAALGVPILDPIGGLVVSGMIFKMGLDSGLPSLKELMDMSVPDATLKHVQKALSELKVTFTFRVKSP